MAKVNPMTAPTPGSGQPAPLTAPKPAAPTPTPPPAPQPVNQPKR